MAKSRAAAVLNTIISALESLPSEDRARTVQAALLVLNAPTVELGPSQGGRVTSAPRPNRPNNAKDFFQSKAPKSKTEELAVAARFLEETTSNELHSREDFEGVFRAARITFDKANFTRDIDNARKKDLFTRNTGKSAQLSAYGQSFIDVLPDRDAAKALTAPKGARKKRNTVRAKREKS